MPQHQVDLSQYNVRTDLAREAHQLAVQRRAEDSGQEEGIPGVRIEETTAQGITTSWIWIDDEQGAQEMGKIPGTYLTLEVPDLRTKDSLLEQRVAAHLAEQFQQFLGEVGINSEDSCLMVGLGNWNVTPDALGPLVVKHTLITRHLFTLAPEQVADGYRSVCAISPGVLGITGIETSDIVSGVVEQAEPDFVIVLDALASRALARVNTTIQVADTGIHPGSGVGNKRKALTKETLGVPVIAIGIPTVVDAITIAHDTIDFLLAHLHREMTGGGKINPLNPYPQATVQELQAQPVPAVMQQRILGLIGGLTTEEKKQLIHEVLAPLGQNLIVTPKEVDSFIGNMAKLVANGINCALHENVNMENIASHTG